MAEKPKIDYDKVIADVLEAIVARIKGDDGSMGKYDYLAKLKPDTVQGLADLSDSQLDSTAECDFLGQAFPSMAPLQSLTRSLAYWSPSKRGKRAEQVTATMISKETNVVPTVLNAPQPTAKKEKKEKEAKE